EDWRPSLDHLQRGDRGVRGTGFPRRALEKFVGGYTVSRRLWLFLAVAVGVCSGLLVSHDYDPGLDFSRLKTWAWAPQPPQADGSSGPASVTSLTHERIRSAVEQRLGAMGFMRVDEQSADFWVQ